MPRVQVSPAKIEIDFTDEKLTSHGGWVFLGHLFRKLQLGKRIGRAIRLKQRRRGASDAQVLLSLVASQVAGGGALSDVDVLREDTVGQILLGLDRVPDSRRLAEYLSRFTETGVVALEAVVQSVAQEVIPAVCQSPCDYIPKRSYALFQARAVLKALAEEHRPDTRGNPT